MAMPKLAPKHAKRAPEGEREVWPALRAWSVAGVQPGSALRNFKDAAGISAVRLTLLCKKAFALRSPKLQMRQ